MVKKYLYFKGYPCWDPRSGFLGGIVFSGIIGIVVLLIIVALINLK